MKHKAIVILCALFALVALLCGCSSNIEELLSAPKLSADQTAVLAVVNSGRESAAKLKYPQSGAYRTPIQFVDLDKDGETEAILCYSDAASGVYARLTVLKKLQDNWQVLGDIEGPGTDIYSLTFLDYGDLNAYILIEWSTLNKTEHEAVLYRLADGVLTRVLTQSCVSLLTVDLTGDGKLELCFVHSSSGRVPFAVSFIKHDGERFVRTATISLNEDMLGCIAMTAGKFFDGTPALFVDENIGNARQTTEVFWYNKAFLAANTGADGVASLCVRPLESFSSRSLFGGETFVPSTLHNGQHQTKWVYWYAIDGESSQLKYIMHANASLSYGLCVPPEIADNVLVTQSSTEGNRIMLSYAESPADTNSAIAELKVLTPGEESQIYQNEGFIYAGRTDRYRYYIKLYANTEVEKYLLNNFVVFQ